MSKKKKYHVVAVYYDGALSSSFEVGTGFIHILDAYRLLYLIASVKDIFQDVVYYVIQFEDGTILHQRYRK